MSNQEALIREDREIFERSAAYFDKYQDPLKFEQVDSGVKESIEPVGTRVFSFPTATQASQEIDKTKPSFLIPFFSYQMILSLAILVAFNVFAPVLFGPVAGAIFVAKLSHAAFFLIGLMIIQRMLM